MSKKCTPLWREAHVQVKMYKTHHCRTTFGSCDVEKVHAVVARSTFRSQNVPNTPAPDHFWKLRCGKVHAVVARSTFRSRNVQNTTCSRHFWRFRCRKSARRCGAKHISKSKCLKKTGFRTTFGGSDVASLHYTTLHYTTLHCTALHYTTLHNTTATQQPVLCLQGYSIYLLSLEGAYKCAQYSCDSCMYLCIGIRSKQKHRHKFKSNE